MENVISLNPQAMEQVIQSIEEQSAIVQRINSNLESHVNILRRGGWIADAADTYYREMDGELMPRMESLRTAFDEASAICNEVADLIIQADDEAQEYLR